MFEINLAQDEEIRDVVGFEGKYAVTSFGRVYSYKSNKFLRPVSERSGYCKVNLCKEGKPKSYKIHRLVAEAFIPNPDNKETVNHINEDKTNNRVDNLEWMTQKENCNHGTRTTRLAQKQSKPVYCITNGKTYPSINEAARQLNLSTGCISAVCKNKQHHTGGYVFCYVDDMFRMEAKED